MEFRHGASTWCFACSLYVQTGSFDNKILGFKGLDDHHEHLLVMRFRFQNAKRKTSPTFAIAEALMFGGFWRTDRKNSSGPLLRN
jgi:hypothetical protein